MSHFFVYSNSERDEDVEIQQHRQHDDDSEDEEEAFDTISPTEYQHARTLAPRPLPRPQWEKAPTCYACDRPFGPTLHRHHCRRCGHSFCHAHSSHQHKLPHLGYDGDVPERVCAGCKAVLEARDTEERVLWRLARCRDFLDGDLTPYFETGVDTVEDAAFRLTQLAIRLARKIPLGAQAYVAIETVEVLRKHGLKGVYGLLLRKEFLAAADLLCRVLGINKKNWPLSVHELSAAIFYALAQHRALRGLRPDGEELMHSLAEEREEEEDAFDESRAQENDDDDEAGDTIVWEGGRRSHDKYLTGELSDSILDETDEYDPTSENKVVDILAMATYDAARTPKDKRRNDKPMRSEKKEDIGEDGNDSKGTTNNPTSANTFPSTAKLPFDPVCRSVPNSLISSLLFYAPLALDFIYAECEVDMQLLAAQQGWRLVYASLDQNHHHHHSANGGRAHDNDVNRGLEGVGHGEHFSDRPASALFAHDGHGIACLSIRGTATIQDVVTDIRAVPVPFPQQQEEDDRRGRDDDDPVEEEWASVSHGSGLALCGMAGAASNIFRETADSLLYLALKGYKIRIVVSLSLSLDNALL